MPVPQLFSLSYYVNLVYEFSNLSGILAILSPEKKREKRKKKKKKTFGKNSTNDGCSLLVLVIPLVQLLYPVAHWARCYLSIWAHSSHPPPNILKQNIELGIITYKLNYKTRGIYCTLINCIDVFNAKIKKKKKKKKTRKSERLEKMLVCHYVMYD